MRASTDVTWNLRAQASQRRLRRRAALQRTAPLMQRNAMPQGWKGARAGVPVRYRDARDETARALGRGSGFLGLHRGAQRRADGLAVPHAGRAYRSALGVCLADAVLPALVSDDARRLAGERALDSGFTARVAS